MATTRSLRNAVFLFVCTLVASAALAQEHGSISGTVKDNTGSPLPGVSVRVTGPVLPQGRQAETDSAGRFLFDNLPPSTYTVTADLAGLGTATRRTQVVVARDTQLELALSPSVTEEITVTAASPAVDMKSTEVNFNYGAEEIQNLPLPRSYAGLLQLVPGAAESETFAGGVNAGGSRQDNQFLVDGANVTNPYFGYLGIETNELDIKDFNVKRAGYAPEFGRAAGVVTNAVTKSGTNELDGAVRFEYQPKEFRAESKHGGADETLDRAIPAFSIGGPLMRDRIFGYASGRFFRGGRTDRTNWVGPVPDQDISSDELFGKITASPTASHFVELGYRNKPNEDNFAGIGSDESPSVATNVEGEDTITTAHWSWTITDKTFTEAKWVRSKNESGSVAVTQLGGRGTFDPRNLSRMGYVFDPNLPLPNHPTAGRKGGYVGGSSLAVNEAAYETGELKVGLTQLFDLGPTGHEVKVGAGYQEGSEELTRISNAWGSITLVQRNTQYQAVYYPDQPTQVGTGATYSLYVQDRITIGDRWVVNAGILANRDVFSQTTDKKRTFLEFGFSDEIQPRLGFTFALRPTMGDKLYANYGRYYNMDQKSTARSLAPRRLYTSVALFDATTGALISDRPNPATVAKNIAPDIDPTYTDEYLAGYATPLGRLWSVDVFGMYRTTKDFIEDFPQTLPASSFIYDNIPNYRKYYAVTLNVKRGFSNRWNLESNYTWSRLYGNYDQDYFAAYGSLGLDGAIFNTSSGLFDGPGSFFDDPNQDGPLTMDRTHVFKLHGSYQLFNSFTIGSYLRVQSGTPWNARGRDWNNRYLVYLEPAGEHRNPTWTNVDLLASYRLPSFGRFSATLEGRVLNLFDQQTRLATDPRVDLGGRIRLTQPPWIEQPTANPNPNFGGGLFYASPRRYVATIRVDF